MKRRLIFGLFAVVACSAAEFPAAEGLLDRFIERSGGVAAYAKAKNVEMIGTVEIAGRNISGKIAMVEEGGKAWTSMELPGIGRVEQGFDGNIGWEMNAIQGARLIEGDEKSALKRGSSYSAVTAWRDDYKAARTVGEETVEGAPAWKVLMTPKEGRAETFYFDKESKLLIRVTTLTSTPLGDIPADVVMSDYKSVDGIMTAFTMTQKAMGQSIVMKFDKITYNATLPKGRFDLPVAVKALVAKQAAQ